jgi:hypothetical protein
VLYSARVNVARPLLLLTLPLLLAAPAARAAPTLTPSGGFAWLARSGTGDPREASGVALALRLGDRPTPRAGWGVTFTWGLTDWDRAAEWIDAGNRAGSWTTDRFADVEAWVRRGEDDDTFGPRLLGALFADMFLAMTYVAVPVCYVGSAGGATSHLQVDVTGTLHLVEGGGAGDAWLELGAGAATLPVTGADWTGVLGPVVGVGARLGPVTLGGRLLWSPPSLNGGARGETVRTGAVTLGVVR